MPVGILKGAGGGVDDLGKVNIEFSVVSDRGVCQLPDAFYRIKKYCSKLSASYSTTPTHLVHFH